MLTTQQWLAALPNRLSTVDLAGYGPKQHGKVRDIYQNGDSLVLITTDRISAFDRVLGLIPFKGQVLNQLSAWWFEQTRDIVANHLIRVPDPNVSIVRIAQPLPVEVVVRGYITGVTSTSLWTMYAKGERKPYGISLPDGLRKNDPLPTPLITPTTKAEAGAHDEQITAAAIVERGLVQPEIWAQVEKAALALFARGQAVAERAGLRLVDTKYEFGLLDGQLLVIDEIHTPDSSRYWSAASMGGDQEPDNFDKEYLRKWYAAQGYRGDGDPPPLIDEIIVEVARRYLTTYEQLTGQTFVPGEQPAAARIARVLAAEQQVVG
ncbi:phosphoribosylaminoimidazolesuccinocarboxamide synthase [soil metagenome]